MMARTSLLMGLIPSSLVMQSMRLESTLFPTKLALEHQAHLKSNVSMSCCATSGIHLQDLFIITLTIICSSTGSARWVIFYTTASNFLKDSPGQPTSEQTALLPWVQSIVIQHYILGKMVFFQGQDIYVDLYWYLNDFIALYLTQGINCTVGNNIQ
jgi:hypothetical protein